MTIAEYDKLVEKHPEEDRALEDEFTKIVKNSKKNIVVSRRM
jgi:cytidylate kinase